MKRTSTLQQKALQRSTRGPIHCCQRNIRRKKEERKKKKKGAAQKNDSQTIKFCFLQTKRKEKKASQRSQKANGTLLGCTAISFIKFI